MRILIVEDEFNLVDVMLPNINGFEILKKIRDKNIKSKVIMLTAKT